MCVQAHSQNVLLERSSEITLITYLLIWTNQNYINYVSAYLDKSHYVLLYFQMWTNSKCVTSKYEHTCISNNANSRQNNEINERRTLTIFYEINERHTLTIFYEINERHTLRKQLLQTVLLHILHLVPHCPNIENLTVRHVKHTCKYM